MATISARLGFDDRASDDIRRLRSLAAALSIQPGKVQTEVIGVDSWFSSLSSLEQDYARRIGRETIVTVRDGADQARALMAAGMVGHVEATAACTSLPLARVWPGSGPKLCYTVGQRAVEALAASRSSVELRTPPSSWKNPPPMQLFAPRPV